MFGKLKAFYAVFQAGKSVATPEAWKRGQITATILAGVFIALLQLAKVFGYDIPMDENTATSIAAGIITLVNWLLTVATTKKIGLPSGVQAEPLPTIVPELTGISKQPNVQEVSKDEQESRATQWLREHTTIG